MSYNLECSHSLHLKTFSQVSFLFILDRVDLCAQLREGAEGERKSQMGSMLSTEPEVGSISGP